MPITSRYRVAVVPIALALALAACGSSASKSSGSATTAGATTTAGGAATTAASAATTAGATTTAAAAVSLKGVCPDTIVIQTDWFPEAEHGALYELMGKDYKVDIKKKVVSGSLITSKGVDTGIKLEIRTGGPATGFQGPSATMATDSSITMGYSGSGAGTDFVKTPLIQVVAPLEKNPQIIMWDPATYPNVKTIEDLGKAGVTMNVFSKDVMALFVAEGKIPASVVDPSYDGSPARFVASAGKIAQQGFATAEPYQYEKEIKEWGKPVAYQLFFDAGYQDYSQTLGVRPADLDKLKPCLKTFVPMVQQASVDFINSPDRANAIIVDTVAQYKDTWVYSKALADYSVATMKKLGIISNGPDKTLGNFDIPRVQTFIDKQIKSGGFTTIPAGFKAETMVTNDFIDPKIGL